MRTPRRRSWFLIIAVLLWTLCFLVGCLRDIPHPREAKLPHNYPTDPVLRPETGMHTVHANRIDVDREERFLVSGSDDKTVRIWDLASGHLLRTIRVPLGESYLGKVTAVAVTPHGSTVAVGAQTPKIPKAYENYLLYLFDRAMGALHHTIEGLPTPVSHLAYAPDGKHLVVLLAGDSDLRVYETRTYREMARDANYGDSAVWAAFDTSGRLVTTSRDGQVRLYDTTFRLQWQAPLMGGSSRLPPASPPTGAILAWGTGTVSRLMCWCPTGSRTLIRPTRPA